MKHLKISPLLPLVVIFSYLTHNMIPFFITYLSLLFHEAIHLFFLCNEKIVVRKILLEPFGICIQTENKPPDSLTVYLSAPVANLLISLSIWLIQSYRPFPCAEYFFFSNLFLGLFNLIPCLPLDGGRALEIYFSKKYDKTTAKQKMRLLSLSLSSAIFASGLWLLWYTKYQYSLILIGIFLLYSCLCQNKLTLCQTIGETAKRQEQTDFPGSRPICYLGARWNLPAQKIIRNFRGDQYYIVHVIKDGKIIKTVTETQILTKILTCDGTLLLSQC